MRKFHRDLIIKMIFSDQKVDLEAVLARNWPFSALISDFLTLALTKVTKKARKWLLSGQKSLGQKILPLKTFSKDLTIDSKA